MICSYLLHGYDVILILKTAQKNSASLRSSIHSLRIRMTSYPCNKYEQITPHYLLSVTAYVFQPWTNPHDLYFEYLIIRFDYLIIPFDYSIIG